MSIYDDGRAFGTRARISGIVEAGAECRDCGWSCSARNAMGLAAQHCDRTGHVVGCHQIIHTTYGPSGSSMETLRSGRNANSPIAE